MKLGLVVAGLVALFVILSFALGVFADFWWFEQLHYHTVFTRMLITDLMLGVIFFILTFVVLYSNLRVCNKLVKGGTRFFVGLSLFISLIVGSAFAQWEIVLRFFNGSSFGLKDMVFSNDIGFYFFELPFYNYMLGYVIVLLGGCLFVSLAYYLSNGVEKNRKRKEDGFGFYIQEDVAFDWAKIVDKSKIHLSILLGLIFVIGGIGIWLLRYQLLFSVNGAVFGAGYMDLHALLPLYTVLSILCVIAGIGLVFYKGLGKKALLPLGVLVLVVIGGLGYAGIVQQLQVQPDEYNMEKMYIKRNIKNTIQAYGLNNVKEKIFDIDYNLSAEDLKESRTTENIRLWDWRPLKETYNQVQLFRTYYNFNDVDTDRYHVNNSYRQMDLSARELDLKDVNAKARTWVNEHLVYTHGYGIVMSPISKIGKEGLPEYIIKDIPPTTMVNRPEIYYGEKTNQFAVVNTGTEEFDYPAGEKNEYTTYKGAGGIQLDGAKRLVYAFRLSSVELLLSGSIQDNSKLMLYRNVKQRIKKIAPFLYFDPDPYVVVDNGELYWIIDAYTVSDSYPYSEKMGGMNYIKNSVKVVVNAYNGQVKFYKIEDEPVVNTYEKMFPELFEDEMPSSLRKHIRYPEALFRIQSKIYSTYHMKDPRVFYNKEDQWENPKELFHDTRKQVEPYYILLELPNNELQFVLMTPFVPKGKNNMIAWLAAKGDDPNYGDIILYKFSKGKLIYGPMQIENRIDQDTEISERLSLWGQRGSEVIRGNLLVIPIKHSILYVEPVYLKATSGGLPQLKKVILVYGDKLVMKDDLESGLVALFEEEVKEKEVKDREGKKYTISNAQKLYDKAQRALKAGNFTHYSQYIEELGKVLEQLSE